MYKNILVPVDLAHADAAGRMIAVARTLADEDARLVTRSLISN